MMTELISTPTAIIDHTQVLSDLIVRFIAEFQVSAESKETYSRCLRPFYLWFQSANISRLDHSALVQYRNHLLERNLSPQTTSTYITAVRALFNWTEASGIYPNVASRLKSQKRQHGFLRDALSKNQVIQLLAAIDTSTIQGKRNLALINLLVRTGLRTIEASRLLVSDIKQKSGTTILLVQGKGQTSKTDFVILYPSTLKPIQDYLHARGDVQTDAPLFVSHSDRNSGSKLATRTIRNIVKDHLRAIGIDDKRVSAHSLRHSCFSLAAEAGCSILEVQQLARHRSITTSAIYVHTTERLKNNAESRIEEFLSDEAVASPEISNNGNGNGGDKNSE